MSDRIKVFFDGGCRPNPGPIEIAVVMGGVPEIVRDLGNGSSMDAEWQALLHALRRIRAQGLTDVVLLGDSAAVVDQVNGRTKARGASGAHLVAFEALAADGARPHVRYIKRSQNLAGIALARANGR